MENANVMSKLSEDKKLENKLKEALKNKNQTTEQILETVVKTLKIEGIECSVDSLKKDLKAHPDQGTLQGGAIFYDHWVIVG